MARATCRRGAGTAAASTSHPLASAAAPSSGRETCVLTLGSPDLAAPRDCPAAPWPWRNALLRKEAAAPAGTDGPRQCARRSPNLPSVRESPRVAADSAPLHSAHKSQNDDPLQGHDHNGQTANAIPVTEVIRSVSSRCPRPRGSAGTRTGRHASQVTATHTASLWGRRWGLSLFFPFQDDTTCLRGSPATPNESSPHARARPGFRPLGLLSVVAWAASYPRFPTLQDVPVAFAQRSGQVRTFRHGQTSGTHACGGTRVEGQHGATHQDDLARVRVLITAS